MKLERCIEIKLSEINFDPKGKEIITDSLFFFPVLLYLLKPEMNMLGEVI